MVIALTAGAAGFIRGQEHPFRIGQRPAGAAGARVVVVLAHG
ncbi:hypothetical protein [Paracoccus sp. M683]|nr:hypothetical protein [Paracoccus sp. M683]